MAIRLSLIVLAVSLLFLAEAALTGTAGPSAAHLSEVATPIVRTP